MDKIGYGKNRDRKPEDRIVGWGKYRGMKMRDMPEEYLEWFVSNAFLHMVARKQWAKEELYRRQKEDFNQKYLGVDKEGFDNE